MHLLLNIVCVNHLKSYIATYMVHNYSIPLLVKTSINGL